MKNTRPRPSQFYQLPVPLHIHHHHHPPPPRPILLLHHLLPQHPKHEPVTLVAPHQPRRRERADRRAHLGELRVRVHKIRRRRPVCARRRRPARPDHDSQRGHRFETKSGVEGVLQVGGVRRQAALRVGPDAVELEAVGADEESGQGRRRREHGHFEGGHDGRGGGERGAMRGFY